MYEQPRGVVRGAAGGRSAGRRPGPSASRSSGFPRRRRCRSGGRATPTWILASAQSTSSPFIQIFSVSCTAAPPSGSRLDSAEWLLCGPRRASIGSCPRQADELGGRESAPCAAASRRRPRPARATSSAAVDRARGRPLRSGNGATAPGSKPVASSTSSRRGDAGLVRSRPPRRSSPRRRGGRPGRARRRSAVADEDERLDDLAELAADRLRRVLGGRRPSGTPRAAPRARCAQEGGDALDRLGPHVSGSRHEGTKPLPHARPVRRGTPDSRSTSRRSSQRAPCSATGRASATSRPNTDRLVQRVRRRRTARPAP